MGIEMIEFEALRRNVIDPDRDAVLAYLRASPTVVDAGIRTEDLIDPGRGLVVPVGFGTDGRLVWELSVLHYLECYEDMAIPRRLRDAAAAAPGPRPEISEQRLTEIAAFLFGHQTSA